MDDQYRVDDPTVAHPGAVVVVVDDDISVCRALSRLLGSVGIPHHTYPSGAAFLESSDPAEALCLILDVHLEEMTGARLMELMTEVAPRLPIICMTGRDDPGITDRALVSGAVGCLRKPFGEEELFDAISRATGGSIAIESHLPLN